VPTAVHRRSGWHRATGETTQPIERSRVPTRDRLCTRELVAPEGIRWALAEAPDQQAGLRNPTIGRVALKVRALATQLACYTEVFGLRKKKLTTAVSAAAGTPMSRPWSWLRYRHNPTGRQSPGPPEVRRPDLTQAVVWLES